MLPASNENFYELGWTLRHRFFFQQLIDQGITDLYDLLLRFDQTEHAHIFKFSLARLAEDQADL